MGLVIVEGGYGLAIVVLVGGLHLTVQDPQKELPGITGPVLSVDTGSLSLDR
jgi:hypothetical protein